MGACRFSFMLALFAFHDGTIHFPRQMRMKSFSSRIRVALLALPMISVLLDCRPPGHVNTGGHIERYLGTLMRRIHGVPGTTMSNVKARGRYHSEKHATLSLRELEAWVRSTFVAGLGVGEIRRVQVATETGNVTTSGRRALLKATEASNDAAVGRIVEAEMTGTQRGRQHLRNQIEVDGCEESRRSRCGRRCKRCLVLQSSLCFIADIRK